MKNLKFTLKALIPAAALLVASCSKDVNRQNPQTIGETETNNAEVTETPGQSIPDQYIVTLKPGALPQGLFSPDLDYATKTQGVYNQIKTILATVPGGKDIELLNVYSTVFTGFAAQLSNVQLTAIQNLPIVEAIEQDQVMGIIGKDPVSERASTKADEKPYGIIRTGHASAAGKRAYVIDTGIDLDHSDLDVNEDLSKSFVGGSSGCGLLGLLFGCGGGSEPSPDDGNGHGTHCAGTIAALDNGSGVLGVAYDAEVVAIKVLSDNGSGSNSGVIQGVDYVASVGQAGEVANMSLGGGASSALDNAVRNAASKGILFSLAAGNDSRNASNSSPARANGANIYTVSAMDSNDRFANFSNFGNPPVDFCAPGVSVKSTYRNGGYATLSGTSMAAPHVAGLLLLRGGAPDTDGFVKNDPDGNPDPIAVL